MSYKNIWTKITYICLCMNLRDEAKKTEDTGKGKKKTQKKIAYF